MRSSQSTMSIFNLALSRLGGEQLSSVEASWEESALGILCNNNFPQLLDEALAAHAWSFALKRQVLGLKQDSSPHPDYQYRYGLPSACLRPVRLYGLNSGERDAHFIIEGVDLLTDISPAELQFVSRVDDPRLFPPMFTTALSWSLAAVLATARNNDHQKQQACQQHYEFCLAEAMARDQNAIRPQRAGSSWQAARAGGRR